MIVAGVDLRGYLIEVRGLVHSVVVCEVSHPMAGGGSSGHSLVVRRGYAHDSHLLFCGSTPARL